MTATRTLLLNQVIEGAGATIEVRLGADGSALDAWFAMDGMPRIESLLRGRPVAQVPAIVEHICGICPVAHHLAGVRALEALVGTPRLTPTADAMRRLLHHGAVLQTHAQLLGSLNGPGAIASDEARDLGRFARGVVAAAGADSHFPQCAVPGGVIAPLPLDRRDHLVAEVVPALERAIALLGQVESQRRGGPPMPIYAGHDVALVDRAGALDLYGDRLRAVAPVGWVTVDGASSEDWTDLVAESRPGDAAPRPYLRALGALAGGYRVGPVAQLRAATTLVTPLAESARRRWVAAGGDAAWARAVVTLHVVEVIEELLRRPELVAGPVLVESGTAGWREPAGRERRQASGWVDGARGLLVHSYKQDAVGVLRSATISTPTAQNETWLASLLRSALLDHGPIDPHGTVTARLRAQLEGAVREADPCLPCTSLPLGEMDVRLRVLDTAREGR